MFRQRFPNVPIMALTATATPRVSQDIMKQLHMRNPVMFSASFNRPNLRYRVEQKTKSAIEDMAERIIEKHSDPFNHVAAGIVYCLSRKDCEKVAEELQVCVPVPRDSVHVRQLDQLAVQQLGTSAGN